MARSTGERPKTERKSGDHRWARAAIKTLFVFSVLVVFSGLIVYAYNKGKEAGGGGAPPIIQAGPAPYKVKPDRPGGMRVANRDKGVYSMINGAKPPEVVERLLPPAETPMAPSAADIAGAPEPETETAPNASAANAAPPPDLTAAPSDDLPAKVADGAQALQAAAAPSPPSKPTPKPPVEKMAAASEARKLAKIAPASGGDYKVQLASLRSDDAVSRSWKRLVAKNPDLLGELKLTIVQRDLGAGKGVYFRMQAGPLPDRVAARDLCSRLKRRKINCLVVRP